MSSLSIAGNTSGSVTLNAPAVAGTTSLTLPGSSGTVLAPASLGTAGQALISNGTANPTWGSAGFNGATTTSSSTDVTLTSTSTQIQNITMTTTGKYVILPDATTLSTKGGVVFNIVNSGTGAVFGVKDSAGNILNYQVPMGQGFCVFLVDNTTAAGLWATTNGPINIRGTVTSVSTITFTTSFNDVCWLSTSLAIFRYDDKLVAASISGTTVTWGTPVTFATYVTNENNLLSMINATTGVVLRKAGSGGAVTLTAFTVSGTTITVGAASTLQAAASGTQTGNVVSIDVSTNKGVCTYYTGTTFTTRIFTVSGTTITLGTAYTATQMQYVAPIYGSTTTFLALSDTTSSRNIRVFSYSGTTISAAGTAFTASYAANTPIGVKAFPDGVTLFYGMYITVSGTTVTSAVLSSNLNQFNISATVVGSTNIGRYYDNSVGYESIVDFNFTTSFNSPYINTGLDQSIFGGGYWLYNGSTGTLNTLSSTTWGNATQVYSPTTSFSDRGYLAIQLGNVA